MTQSKYDLDGAIHLLRTLGYHETLRRLDVTGTALRNAFLRAKLGPPTSYAVAAAAGQFLDENAELMSRMSDAADTERPAPPTSVDVSELDYGDDATESDGCTQARGDARIAEAPPPEPHPVDVRVQRDIETRLRRQVDQLVDELRDARARQEFIDAVATREPPRILPRERSSGIREFVPIVAFSDWHVEEPVDPASVAYRNEYNLDIADQRIKRVFDAAIWNVEHHRASGRIAIRDMVAWLGGDLYSGYIHPELVESNLLSPTETIRWLIPRIRDGFATLLERLKLESLTVPCSFGNHGRFTDKTRISTGHANSFDLLLYHAIADSFAHEKRVRFEITPSSHQYVDVLGHTIHFTHGDSVRYQGGVGGLGIPLLKAIPAWERVKPAAVHVVGHHHTLRDYGRAVVNGSLIGYGPYSQFLRAEFEEPKQAMFYIDSKRGKCFVTELWAAEHEAAASG